MTRLGFLIVLTALCGAAPATKPAAPVKPLRVLFIGNSYTQVNDLPALFRKVSMGAKLPAPFVDSITPGGKTLLQHLEDPKTLEKIDAGCGPRHDPWDVVILQEQSQTPAFADVDPRHGEQFLAGAAGLYDRVKAKHPAARVILYQTWARHPDHWKAGKPEPMGKDAADMQARLTKWYAKAAEHIKKTSNADRKEDVIVAPVGDVWAKQYATKTPVLLHSADHSHPAPAGTYLAALVIFKTIYAPVEIKTTERGGLSDPVAKAFQRLAND